MASIAEIRAFLLGLEGVTVHETSPDYFFFVGAEQKFPFATIVTHDDAYDSASGLDRHGVFRLNMPTDKASFSTLFPTITSRRQLEAASFDYQAIDTLFPHPVYGRMRWVSVINPDITWPQCRQLLEAARHMRELRPDSW
jgi:hypothetical protein